MYKMLSEFVEKLNFDPPEVAPNILELISARRLFILNHFRLWLYAVYAREHRLLFWCLLWVFSFAESWMHWISLSPQKSLFYFFNCCCGVPGVFHQNKQGIVNGRHVATCFKARFCVFRFLSGVIILYSAINTGLQFINAHSLHCSATLSAGIISGVFSVAL